MAKFGKREIGRRSFLKAAVGAAAGAPASSVRRMGAVLLAQGFPGRRGSGLYAAREAGQ